MKSEPEPIIRIAAIVLKDNLSDDDRKELREAIREDGQAFQSIFDSLYSAQSHLVCALSGKKNAKLNQTMYEERLTQVQESLGYKEASGIERLLIERVILCWLRMERAENALTAVMKAESVTYREIEWVEKQATLSHSRYLRACDALTKTQFLLSRTNVDRLEKTREFLDPKRKPEGKPDLKVIKKAG